VYELGEEPEGSWRGKKTGGKNPKNKKKLNSRDLQ
jgi:hypothetical protein